MMLAHIRELKPQLRKSEQKVAEHVLARPTTVVNATIADLAQLAGVSEPSVIRFCRAVGYSGYADFKLRLAQSLATGVPYVHSDVSPGEPTADLSYKICDRSIATLIQVRNELNEQALERALALLSDAKRIEFYGLGSSGIVAADAQHKFFPLGAPTTAYADPHLQSTSAATLRPGDVVVAISASGSTRDMLTNARIALDAGADVVAITKTGSPLARLATVALPVNAAEDEDVYIPMTMRLAFLVIIDILAVGVALRRGPSLIPRLEKLKRILKDKRLPREA